MNEIKVTAEHLEDLRKTAENQVELIGDRIARLRQLTNESLTIPQMDKEKTGMDLDSLNGILSVYKSILGYVKYACVRYRENEFDVADRILQMKLEG